MKARDEGIENVLDIMIQFLKVDKVVNASWQRPIHTAVSTLPTWNVCTGKNAVKSRTNNISKSDVT